MARVERGFPDPPPTSAFGSRRLSRSINSTGMCCAHGRVCVCACALVAGNEFALILLESPSEGGSVLTKESLDALWEIDAKVLEIEVINVSTYSMM